MFEERMFEERDVPGRVYLKRVLEERDVAGGATVISFLFVALLRFACRSRFVRRSSFMSHERSLPLVSHCVRFAAPAHDGDLASTRSNC